MPALYALSDLAPPSSSETLGVYVHFPWCLAKCPYCDFLSIPSARDHIPHAAYADAVIAELALRAPSLPQLPLRSIFFGGGTPSLWQPEELARVLAAIRATFAAGEAPVEITAECNPSSFDDRVARGLRAAGVNRISLGVQSLDAGRLQFLGRLHDGAGALSAVQRALATGFEQVSADLIFGLAGQSPEAAGSEAETIAALGLRHISAYSLTIEPGTQFGELARRGRLPLLGEDQVADSFSAVERALASRGLEHYEISNYARPGSEARHNLGYWRGDAYLGLGTGAWGTVPTDSSSSTNERLRYRNTPAVERYLKIGDAEQDQLWAESTFVAAKERLSPETRLREALMLGLRLAEGIDCDDVEARTGACLWTRERQRVREKWEKRGVLRFDGARLRLAREHWLIADGVIGELM